MTGLYAVELAALEYSLSILAGIVAGVMARGSYRICVAIALALTAPISIGFDVFGWGNGRLRLFDFLLFAAVLVAECILTDEQSWDALKAGVAKCFGEYWTSEIGRHK